MTDFQQIEEKTGNVAGVSHEGERYVAPRYFSDPYYVRVDAASTPFEIVPGKSGKCFVVTSVLFATDKNFGSATTAELLTIYEASPADLDTNLKTFVKIDFLKNDRLVATGLNLMVTCSLTLVAIADDNNVDVTIAGYYMSAENDS